MSRMRRAERRRWPSARVMVAGAIVIVLAVTTLVLAGLSWRAIQRVEQRSAALEMPSSFDGARAYETLKKVVAFGPRPPGSEQAAALRKFIRTEVEAAGLE
ncbi:MAG: hypothetical protein FJY92_10185, partial [Candidatus Hydrogenedentes bacterium]|nr:hypothetical protein [Candidatus Hydrogenedentota bacterium]